MSHTAPALKAVPLSEAKYASFRHVSHCLHLDEAVGALNHLRLTPVRATATLASIRSKVLWCSLGFSNGHSKHGNVSFVADWGQVTSKLGSTMYYIDQTMIADRCCTRLLLTRSSYKGALQEVDNVQGAPVIEKMGQLFHVVRCRNKMNCDGPHEVKLAIEADEGEANWLFSVSHVLVNDHFFVNLPTDKPCKRKDGRTQRYKQHKCCKYNSLLNALCPFQLRREDAHCRLRQACPGVVLSDIRDLTVFEEQKNSHSDVKSTDDEISDCRDNQKRPSTQQHYNCLEDPKNRPKAETSLCELNNPKVYPLDDTFSSVGASASVIAEAQGASRCEEYHRYRPTKEEDTFQQGQLETAANDAREDVSGRTVTGQVLSFVDRSSQIYLVDGHYKRADNDLVCLNISSDRKAASVSSRALGTASQGNETKHINSYPDEIVEPKLEIDLMKLALDDVKHKLLKLEKALAKPRQPSSPDKNSEISNMTFSTVVLKEGKQDLVLKQVGTKVLSRGREIQHRNVSADNKQVRNNSDTQDLNHYEPNHSFNSMKMQIVMNEVEHLDRVKDLEWSASSRVVTSTGVTSRGQNEARAGVSPSRVVTSTGVTSRGRDEARAGVPSAADRVRPRKRSSTLYRSTLSSAVKARPKRESATTTKRK